MAEERDTTAPGRRIATETRPTPRTETTRMASEAENHGDHSRERVLDDMHAQEIDGVPPGPTQNDAGSLRRANEAAENAAGPPRSNASRSNHERLQEDFPEVIH